MKQKDETIKYNYPFSKEQFLQTCKKYCADHNDRYLFKQIDDHHFQLGVERGGHRGGYWYVASIEGEKI